MYKENLLQTVFSVTYLL